MMTVAAMAVAAPRVSLLTATPGEEIYELEGHTALRIVDGPYDYVVNWGVFDFSQPNFVGRFVAGQTDYMCDAAPTAYFLQSYLRQGRQVIEQTLNLDSAQVARVVEAVNRNLLPENRVYRYNYVLDNCATRPLNILEQAVGRPLASGADAGTTFRAEMQRFHEAFPWYQFGIDLALGRSIDRPITIRQTAFAPVTLRRLLANDSIVAHTEIHGTSTLVNRPTPWFLTPMCAALLVFALSVVVTVRRGARVFDTLLFGANFLLGCVLTYLIFVSTHEATSPNILLLWLNPLCLLGVILPQLKHARRLNRLYFGLNLAALLALCIAAPLLGRTMNAAFWPLIAADALRSAARLVFRA